MPFRDLPGVVQCRFKKGERLMRAGEPIDYIYYLIKGTVYREIVTDKGYESILSRKHNDGIAKSLIGILAAYNRNAGNTSNNDFFAYTDCTCYKIPLETCKAYLRQHPDVLEEVLHHAMDEYDNVWKMFYTRREGHGSARLCALLLERARETEQGLMVPRKCTNVEISKLLSIHKVTVSRMLRALKEEGAVARTSEGLVLRDPERIKQYAENKIELEYE